MFRSIWVIRENGICEGDKVVRCSLLGFGIYWWELDFILVLRGVIGGNWGGEWYDLFKYYFYILKNFVF